MGPSGSRSKLIYLINTSYKDQINYRFTFVYKGIFVIT